MEPAAGKRGCPETLAKMTKITPGQERPPLQRHQQYLQWAIWWLNSRWFREKGVVEELTDIFFLLLWESQSQWWTDGDEVNSPIYGTFNTISLKNKPKSFILKTIFSLQKVPPPTSSKISAVNTQQTCGLSWGFKFAWKDKEWVVCILSGCFVVACLFFRLFFFAVTISQD